MEVGAPGLDVKKDSPKMNSSEKYCFYFNRKKGCKFGDACKFKHQKKINSLKAGRTQQSTRPPAAPKDKKPTAVTTDGTQNLKSLMVNGEEWIPVKDKRSKHIKRTTSKARQTRDKKESHNSQSKHSYRKRRADPQWNHGRPKKSHDGSQSQIGVQYAQALLQLLGGGPRGLRPLYNTPINGLFY